MLHWHLQKKGLTELKRFTMVLQCKRDKET